MREGRREAMMRLQDESKANAICIAEHRVAEAALNADIYYYDRNQEWVVTANEAGREFIAARDDLRKMKGEAEMRRASE